MFCPQCGTESSSGLQYCRQCGANLKVIGKAVTLSEAIARSDRGPLPKIKEMMKKLNMDEVSEEISTALDEMHVEMIKDSGALVAVKPFKKEKTPPTAQERREKHITHGLISLFSGIGLMIFLYFLAGSLVLRIPENIRAQLPFDIDSAVQIIWLAGLMPTLTGIGRILAGLSIRPEATLHLDQPGTTNELPPRYEPASVTERTTNILNRDVRS
ncbi:MAG TPA: hypothetical protein VIT88_05155 [Pyrinomonadaceae bacterium]